MAGGGQPGPFGINTAISRLMCRSWLSSACPGNRHSAAGRTGTGHSLRQNALDPGFHGVPAGPVHPDGDADGASVT